MTERLASLLHDEAADLPAPPPPTAAIVLNGQRLRRRRRAGRALGGGALALALAVGSSIVLDVGPLQGRDDDPRTVLDPASAPVSFGAVASGDEVFLGSGDPVEVDGVVKSVYYTSAGVVVRTGASATTDAPDSSYSLITEDGQVSSFGLDLGDRVPSTDPTLPYLAYATASDGPTAWRVVIRDVRTGEVATSIDLDGDFTWGGWVAPPVSLSGDHVYVGMDEATLDVEWRTGRVTDSGVLPASTMPIVHGGRSVLGGWSGGRQQVVDVQTGEVLLDLPSGDDTSLLLSPGGTHALQRGYAVCGEDDICRLEGRDLAVYDVEEGTRATLDIEGGVLGLGWTPTGELVKVDADSVDVCNPDSGACTEDPLVIDPTDLRLGGSVYEA